MAEYESRRIIRGLLFRSSAGYRRLPGSQSSSDLDPTWRSDFIPSFQSLVGRSRMSRASKLTLLGTSIFAASTIIFVHFQQKSEKAVRRELVSFPLPP